jgi:hypothetical protein
MLYMKMILFVPRTIQNTETHSVELWSKMSERSELNISRTWSALKSITNESLICYCRLQGQPTNCHKTPRSCLHVDAQGETGRSFPSQGIHTIMILHPNAVPQMQKFNSNKGVRRTKFSDFYFAILSAWNKLPNLCDWGKVMKFERGNKTHTQTIWWFKMSTF